MIRTYGAQKPRLHPSSFIHDSAEVIGRVSLGRSSSVWPFSVLRADVDAIRVGDFTNIQDLSVIHCRSGRPAVIGSRVTVGHRVVIHGSVIGNSCLIGMGSVIMEAVIGDRCLVGAGALVLAGTRIPAGSLVLGSPAKAVRKLTRAELSEIERSARQYAGFALKHRDESRVLFR